NEGVGSTAECLYSGTPSLIALAHHIDIAAPIDCYSTGIIVVGATKKCVPRKVRIDEQWLAPVILTGPKSDLIFPPLHKCHLHRHPFTILLLPGLWRTFGHRARPENRAQRSITLDG